MIRLTPHAQALIVPHSSGAGCVCPGASVSADDALRERVEPIRLDVLIADRRVAPAAAEDLGGHRRVGRKARAASARRPGGGGGGPPPKLTSRITGTGFVAAAGV